MADAPLLQGTDGLRGRVVGDRSGADTEEAALEGVVGRHEVSPLALEIVAMATGAWLAEEATQRPLVVVGWDPRPRNPELVAAVTRGLRAAGCRVGWAGEVPTPGLLWCALQEGADAGLMVTASHNPVDESGLKTFDRHGRKLLPEEEARVSALAWALARGEIPHAVDGAVGASRPDFTVAGVKRHRSGLRGRLTALLEPLGLLLEHREWTGVIGSPGLLVDSSRGSATTWLSGWLRETLGIDAREVSSGRPALNAECGAGELSVGASWTWDEVRAGLGDHALFEAVRDTLKQRAEVPWRPGEVVGLALDGDADRCLLLEAGEAGLMVVDGDQMAAAWLKASAVVADDGLWSLVTTIESDLGVLASLRSRGLVASVDQVAVGDRWLAAAMAPADDGWLDGEAGGPPRWLGVEDSGHLVLPFEHPGRRGRWAVAGDGIVTALCVLHARWQLARTGSGGPVLGVKRRVTVWDADRSRWSPGSELANRIEELTASWLQARGQLTDWGRTDIAGDSSLLLLEGHVDRRAVSLGVRNSGTEARTAVTWRAAPAGSSDVDLDEEELLELLWLELAAALKPWMNEAFLKAQLKLLHRARAEDDRIEDPTAGAIEAGLADPAIARLRRRWLRDERLATDEGGAWRLTERALELLARLVD